MADHERGGLGSADSQRIEAEVLGLDSGTDPFVAAVRATRMPMIITNPRLHDNPVVFANDSFCRLTGYDADEILGRNCRFLQGDDTDQSTVRAVHDAVKAVRPIEIDIRNHRKSGVAASRVAFLSSSVQTSRSSRFLDMAVCHRLSLGLPLGLSQRLPASGPQQGRAI